MPKNLNVIYCEDSFEMRNFMAEAMKEFCLCSIELFSFSTIEEAIDLLRQSDKNFIDFIISDLRIGNNDKDGLKLYHFLEQRKLRTPFYLYTSSSREDLSDYLKKENFFYFHKSNDIEKILKEMQKIYEQQKAPINLQQN